MRETVRQQLATSLLGEPVGEWLLELHRAGHSYKDIADELAKATGGQGSVTRQASGLWRQAADKEQT
ncbi:MAG: hypothetical protein M3R09_07685 [Actinomycetota bacterium]|nr:hypothetical protein [Actinomycetota bacterium]